MLPGFIDDTTKADALRILYGNDQANIANQHARYVSLVEQFRKRFGLSPTHIYSSPGRCELSGNHTDHNGGLVLATAINLDIIAAATTSEEYALTVYSSGYQDPFHVDLNSLHPNPLENQTCQLLRGVASGFNARGLRIGGVRIILQSDVLFASGLSSSAALEMLLATIFNDFYNHASLGVHDLAAIGQEAESRFWQKPVGLLDQLTIGTGGVVYMSFEDSTHPFIESLHFDFESFGYSLLLVNPGGDHSQLTSDYRQVPTEMKAVAQFFGKQRLIEVDAADVLFRISDLRQHVGDRAILRSLHFFQENVRVKHQLSALQAGDVATFLKFANESGSSSWRFLQNVFAPNQETTQSLALALALAELQTQELQLDSAHRVHGGGFGGTILLIVPHSSSPLYEARMTAAFGPHTCHRLRTRPVGCIDVATLDDITTLPRRP
jgi:galactokinase